MVTRKWGSAAANALPVNPANLSDRTIMNRLPEAFLVEVIFKGGGAVGKSSIMPALGKEFNEQQLRDIVLTFGA